MRNFFLTLAALALFVQAANARAGEAADSRVEPDARVRKLLDSRQIEYEITPLGNSKVVFDLKDGRKQLAFVTSKTYRYRDREMREIMSPGYQAAGPLAAEIANRLLLDNDGKRLGAWALQKQGGNSRAWFVARIPADSDADSFFAALRLTLEAADAMEKELTGKDEF